jgi:hypothetical protein
MITNPEALDSKEVMAIWARAVIDIMLKEGLLDMEPEAGKAPPR